MGSQVVVRRAVGAAVLPLLAFATGCSSEPGPSRPEATAGERSSSRAPGTSAPDPTATTDPPQRPPRYHPLSTEVDAEAKRVAARAVEALPRVRRVTYTQYFGYLPPRADILVEADFASGGGATYSVLISRPGDRWRVDDVREAHPPAALPDPGPLARRVLDSNRITLPWAGRADVAAGDVADAVLRSMLAIARQHTIGVSVLISAHPVDVFGTDRRSDHPDGRAYDIGRIDGRLVVFPGTMGRVRDVMRLAAGTGAYQVGGPEDLDGGGSQYFSDATHSDHVHVGFPG
ncbi:hypothetical protein [Nocardioides sp. MH1]|uniref:hypothetical protein n=1 Tax=Nocardioides sp. MH1 TaxID=3242490 RepID=UPI00352205E3